MLEDSGCIEYNDRTGEVTLDMDDDQIALLRQLVLPNES
jgi:hypothetical protein